MSVRQRRPVCVAALSCLLAANTDKCAHREGGYASLLSGSSRAPHAREFGVEACHPQQRKSSAVGWGGGSSLALLTQV